MMLFSINPKSLPIKIYNSKNEFIFSKGKKNISYNKSSKIFKSLENVFPGSKEYDVYAVLGYIETKKKQTQNLGGLSLEDLFKTS